MKTITFTLVFLCFSLSSLFASWTTISDFPVAVQDGAFALTLAGKAYIGGGLMGTEFYEYDPEKDQYRKLNDVPSPGGHLGWAFAFGIDDKVYVAGGSYATASDLSDELWQYDIPTDTWVQKASFPGGQRDGGFAFSLHGKGYMGGGFDGAITRSDLYEYDPDEDTWTQKTDYAGGAVIFPSFFVIGNEAYVGLGAASSEKSDLHAYDPSSDTWTEKASFPGPLRQANFFFSYKTSGFVGGGMIGYSSSYQDFWEYNSTTDSWSELTIPSIPTQNTAWGIAFTHKNQFYVGLGVHMPSFQNNQTIHTNAIDDPALSVSELNQTTRIHAYPNPGSGPFMIALPQVNAASIRSLQVRNQLGQAVPFDWESTKKGIFIRILRGVPDGIYYVSLETDQQVYQSKIILERL